MGALIEIEGNAGIEKSRAEKVYQLVRVDVDGRLVPATEDELMEVEHLLKDDRSLLQSVQAQCPSSELLVQKTSNVEGPRQHAGVGLDSQDLHIKLEQERLMVNCVSVDNSSMEMVERDESSDHPNNSQMSGDNCEPGKSSAESVASPTNLNVIKSDELMDAENTSGAENDAVDTKSVIYETHTSSQPDFSILKGELCLDNLTIRELQEVFWATFGRQTSVKDKLWLKRRITMGLTNSYEVPTTSIVIKDGKVVQDTVNEQPCPEEQDPACPEEQDPACPASQVNASSNENFGNYLGNSAKQITAEQALSGKRLRKPLLEYDSKNENIQMEQNSTKRARKPTRRYIEELSDVETRECTGKPVSSAKDPGNCQLSPKPRVKVVRDIGSLGRSFVTRVDSIGGSGVQIPYASRMRRGRPRKDLYALMNFHGLESDKRAMETSYSDEEHDLSLEKINYAGNTSSDNNADIVHAGTARKPKLGVKRKHHRAWTLCEVLKLVEGVARYGAGRWSEIRRVAFASYSYRTSVDLKDKWRNLIRASFAQYPPDNVPKNFRKPASVTIPSSILLRVRELAEMHPQTGVDYGQSKFAAHNERIVHEKQSGFL